MTTVVVMGVAGCGKSTFGQALASVLQTPWIEGDDYHSEASRSKMAAGIPLTDEDRAGWLLRLAEVLQAHPAGCVVGCSALKRAYRDVLRIHPDVRFAYLKLSEQQALERVKSRQGHFFTDALVASQFAALESPQAEPDVITLDTSKNIADLLLDFQSQLSLLQA
jgi:gluconokinase